MLRDLPFCLVCLLLAAAAGADTTVYRCVGPDGEPMFSQQACPGTLLELAAPEAPARAAGLRDSERAWLQAREREIRRDGRRAPKAAADPRQAKRAVHQCQSKRRALDQVNADLRRGYKPAQGERLRRRRQAYEEYLAAFCGR